MCMRYTETLQIPTKKFNVVLLKLRNHKQYEKYLKKHDILIQYYASWITSTKFSCMGARASVKMEPFNNLYYYNNKVITFHVKFRRTQKN